MTGVLPGWVTDPELVSMWERVRLRYEQAGRTPRGFVLVPVASRGERHAVGALLGRTVTRASVRIDLAALDARLRERVDPGGLDKVLTTLFGAAPVDRPAVRALRERARSAPLDLAASLVTEPWAEEWIAGLRRSGVLTPVPDAEQVVHDAATVLRVVTGSETLRTSRVELAARLVGDAHALDRDRLVHLVVVRGLAAAAGTPVPSDARGLVDLWSRFGVEPDLLSRTCLTWRLRAGGDGSVAQRLGVAADAGDPVHLTEWDLRRVDAWMPEQRVLVCENPRVLEAVAEQDLAGWSVVCTSGEPNLVADAVIARVVGAGATSFIHGDFDWAGIAIINRAISRHGVNPLCMEVDDYVRAVQGSAPTLVGAPVNPSWADELGAAMHRHGRAVHEETVLPELLAALAEST